MTTGLTPVLKQTPPQGHTAPVTAFSIYLIAWKTMLCLFSRKSTATLQCVYISTIFHDDVLIKGVDEPPELLLNN